MRCVINETESMRSIVAIGIPKAYTDLSIINALCRIREHRWTVVNIR